MDRTLLMDPLLSAPARRCHYQKIIRLACARVAVPKSSTLSFTLARMSRSSVCATPVYSTCTIKRRCHASEIEMTSLQGRASRRLRRGDLLRKETSPLVAKLGGEVEAPPLSRRGALFKPPSFDRRFPRTRAGDAVYARRGLLLAPLPRASVEPVPLQWS